jgi:hypothetical protein
MEELIKQAPYIAALVIIVFVFLNAQAKQNAIFIERDKAWQATISALTEQIITMQMRNIEHAEETTAGIAEMHRVTRSTRSRTRKTDKK